MSFSYDKLWKLAIDKKINKTQLRDQVGITSATLARLSKNEPVSMEVLGRICKNLECDISDIVEYIDVKEVK
ncbi:TPA: helix-turn-helix transcriptional regulator [Bacillus cereus]|nr:helix-turn-helix transcriptional regulator [Bacillus cereus]